MAKTAIKFLRIVGARWILPRPGTVPFWVRGSAVHSQNSFFDVFFVENAFLQIFKLRRGTVGFDPSRDGRILAARNSVSFVMIVFGSHFEKNVWNENFKLRICNLGSDPPHGCPILGLGIYVAGRTIFFGLPRGHGRFSLSSVLRKFK